MKLNLLRVNNIHLKSTTFTSMPFLAPLIYYTCLHSSKAYYSKASLCSWNPFNLQFYISDILASLTRKALYKDFSIGEYTIAIASGSYN